MPPFNVAMIRFRQSATLYPVNCDDGSIRAGTQVIVRMVGQPVALQPAEVVEIVASGRPCKNSIVCREVDADAYGTGPAGVNTLDDLKAFLLGFFRYAECPVLFKGFGGVERHEKWDGALMRPNYLWGAEGRWPITEGTIILLGPSGIGGIQPDERRLVWTEAGTLLLGPFDRIREFKALDKSPFRQAAEYVEGDLTLDLGSDRDTSIRDIRDAVSGGGPAYLSDDVWI